MDRVTKVVLGLSGSALIALLAIPSGPPKAEAPSTPDLPIAGVLAAEAAAQYRESMHVEGAPRDLLEQQLKRAEQLSFQRDPFAEPAPKAAPEPEPERKRIEKPAIPPDIELTGISIFGDDHRALANGRLVQAGDVLPGPIHVMRVERTSITVLFEGREWTVPLGESQ